MRTRSSGAVRRKGGGGGRVRTNPAFGGQPSRPQLGNSTCGAAGHLGLTCLAVDQVLHIGAPGRKWLDKPTVVLGLRRGERTRAALQHLKRQHRRTGSVPYGWRVSDDGKRLEPDPAEQAVVELARELRAAGNASHADVRMKRRVDEIATARALRRTGGVVHGGKRIRPFFRACGASSGIGAVYADRLVRAAPPGAAFRAWPGRREGRPCDAARPLLADVWRGLPGLKACTTPQKELPR